MRSLMSLCVLTLLIVICCVKADEPQTQFVNTEVELVDDVSPKTEQEGARFEEKAKGQVKEDDPWFLPPPPEWGPMPPTMYMSYWHKPYAPPLATANYYPLYSKEAEFMPLAPSYPSNYPWTPGSFRGSSAPLSAVGPSMRVSPYLAYMTGGRQSPPSSSSSSPGFIERSSHLHMKRNKRSHQHTRQHDELTKEKEKEKKKLLEKTHSKHHQKQHMHQHQHQHAQQHQHQHQKQKEKVHHHQHQKEMEKEKEKEKQTEKLLQQEKVKEQDKERQLEQEKEKEKEQEKQIEQDKQKEKEMEKEMAMEKKAVEQQKEKAKKAQQQAKEKTKEKVKAKAKAKTKVSAKERAKLAVEQKRHERKEMNELIHHFASLPDPDDSPFQTISSSLPTLSHSARQ